MEIIEKIEYISNKLPYGYEILIRNNQSDRSFDHKHKWFVHVYEENRDIYNEFNNDLNKMLDEAIVIVDGMKFDVKERN